MLPYNMIDVCGLLGIPVPPGRAHFETVCPACGGKRFDINVAKNVCNCPKCDTGGGMNVLYSLFTGIPKNEVFREITKKLGRGAGADTNQNAYQAPTEAPLASLEKRDGTYCALLDQLSLAADHRASLKARGFTDAEIDWLGYRTTPMTGHRLITENLQMQGCYLKGVPPFFRMASSKMMTLKRMERGILVPVRNLDAKIQGITSRNDKVRKGKFSWLSSANMLDGCAAKAWAHYVGDWKDGEEDIFLTEGPMKADLAYLITRKPFIAIPGVSATDGAVEMLQELKKRGLKRVRIALDMDYLDMEVDENGEITNEHSQVFKSYAKLIRKITDLGLIYTRVKWPREYKGIDDYLAAKYRGVGVKAN